MAKKQQIKELDEISHVLLRPDTFVGSTKATVAPYFVAEKDDEGNVSIANKEVEVSPASIRVFDEALDNACDNVARSEDAEIDPGSIKITVRDNSFTIYNEGMHISVSKDAKGKFYQPYMAFGRFRTSSNFNDDDDRGTKGRNGLGIVLANVFSSEFSIRVADPELHLLYEQTWKNHMREVGNPEITKYKGKIGFTEVTYVLSPEVGIEEYSDDIKAIFLKKVIDCVAFLSSTVAHDVPITFNDEPVVCDGIAAYAAMYGDYSEKKTFSYENETTSLLLIDTPDAGQVISLVNGSATSQGGIHVDAWSSPFVEKIRDYINDTYKRGYKKNHIEQHLTLFLFSAVKNPAFSTQTKEKLVAMKGEFAVPNFGDDLDVLLTWDTVEQMAAQAEAKAKVELKKTEGKRSRFVNIEKYVPAFYAGTNKSMECAMFFTEGDGAANAAIQGIQRLKDGTKYNGTMPLRGKIVSASKNQAKANKNKEIINIKKILGLSSDKDYEKQEDLEKLNYGQMIILSDQDPDGDHIRGLVLSLFNTMYRPLLCAGYVYAMMTPLVRATKGKGKKVDVVVFYSNSAFKKWQTEQGEDEIKKWKIKYFKGLGTLEDRDISFCFDNPVLVKYVYDETAEESLQLAFGKGDEDARKQWLRAYYDRDVADMPEPTEQRTITSFVQNELAAFGLCAVARAIPSIMDGFNLSQRKVIYAMMKEGINRDIGLKVSRLCGQVGVTSNYHQGDQGSLEGVITKMAQGFPRSNNVPLLFPGGQFGNRLGKCKKKSKGPGSNYAPGRYTESYLQKIVYFIFREEDMVILEYEAEGGHTFEPKRYYPIVPICLINRVSGIGVGYSTNVPQHNPADLIAWIRAFLAGEDTPDLLPWYRWYTGEIKRDNKGKIFDYGVFEQKANKIIVTEVPADVSFSEYMEKLKAWQESKQIKNFTYEYQLESSGDDHCTFTLTGYDNKPTHKSLGLVSSIPITNMVLLADDGFPHRYDSVDAIMTDFCTTRLDTYERRKVKQVEILTEEANKYKLKIKFLNQVLKKKLNINDEDIEQQMEEKGFPLEFLSMQLRSLTAEKMSSLKKDLESVEEKLSYYTDTPAADIWLNELAELEVQLDKLEKAAKDRCQPYPTSNK